MPCGQDAYFSKLPATMNVKNTDRMESVQSVAQKVLRAMKILAMESNQCNPLLKNVNNRRKSPLLDGTDPRRTFTDCKNT